MKVCKDLREVWRLRGGSEGGGGGGFVGLCLKSPRKFKVRESEGVDLPEEEGGG